MNAVRAIWRNQLRLLLADPSFLLTMLGMSVLIMLVLKDTMGISLLSDGYTHATGSEQVVPGQAVTFGLFIASNMAYFVFQEHIGNTWDRLRAANVPGLALTTGFSAPWFVMTILYQIVLFGVGVLFMDLRLDGVWVQTLVVMVCLAALYEGITVLLLSFVSSLRNFQALVYVGGIALGSFGGALVPVANLPSWIQSIAPAIPSYWAMRAFNSLLLDRESYGALVLPCSILLACAAVSFTIGSARFDAEKRKLS